MADIDMVEIHMIGVVEEDRLKRNVYYTSSSPCLLA